MSRSADGNPGDGHGGAGGAPDEAPWIAAPSTPDAASLPRRRAESEPVPHGDDDRRTPLGAIRDNVEAFAFAIVLALLLRHFCLEVFKIPTPSMEPTLFGENSGSHPGTDGDRILVDKFAYLLSDPARWDVLVFHYPLDWSRHFIKRCVGLPGERLRIVRGDPWVAPASAVHEGEAPTLHPARKPRSVREQLYVPIWPPTGAMAKERVADAWRDMSGPGVAPFATPDSATAISWPGGRATAGVEEPWAELRFWPGFPIRDTWRADTDPRGLASDGLPVPDVRLRATVLAQGPAEVELSWSPGDGRRHLLRVASAGREPSAARTRTKSQTLDAVLVPKRAMALELESVDGDLRAWVDGKEASILSDELPMAEAERIEDPVATFEPQELSIRLRGAAVTLTGLRVDHDLYYTNHRTDSGFVPMAGETLSIPDDGYFMLGDNTRRSSDSRRWTAAGRKLKDGTEIWWEWSTMPKWITKDGKTWNEVVDVEGVTRRWLDDDRDPETSSLSKRMPTVARDRIVGRAWFALVFWPLKGQSLERIRFIH